MSKPTIWVGTANQDKINAVKEALIELKIDDFNVVGIEVESHVSSQPLGELETTKGAGFRASDAFEVAKKLNKEKLIDMSKDLSIGIENGIINGFGYGYGEQCKFYDVPVAVLHTHTQSEYITGKGPAIPISYEANKLKEYQAEIKKFDNKVTEHFSNNAFTRTSSCKIACMVVLGAWKATNKKTI